jgi:hypothetical protein
LPLPAEALYTLKMGFWPFNSIYLEIEIPER